MNQKQTQTSMAVYVDKTKSKTKTRTTRRGSISKPLAQRTSIKKRNVHLVLRSPPQQSMLPFIKKVKGVVRLSARKVLDAYPQAIKITARYGNCDHIMTLDYKGVPRWTRLPKSTA